MKTYRNEELEFEIEVPEGWPRPIMQAPDSLIFDRYRWCHCETPVLWALKQSQAGSEIASAAKYAASQ
jgi:hypothetical protein